MLKSQYITKKIAMETNKHVHREQGVNATHALFPINWGNANIRYLSSNEDTITFFKLKKQIHTFTFFIYCVLISVSNLIVYSLIATDWSASATDSANCLSRNICLNS